MNEEHNIYSTDKEDHNLHPAPEGKTEIWGWVKFGLAVFTVLFVYIYNSSHATKALKNRAKLQKDLQELHTEKVYLESKITNASKQTEVAKKLEHSGLKTLTNPPFKIEKESTK